MVLGGATPDQLGNPNSSLSNRALDGASDYLAFIFRAATTAPLLTKAAIRWGAKTGTPPEYKLSLQGVDISTGRPDGIIKGGDSPVSVTLPLTASNGHVEEYTFTNSYQTTAGELLALVISTDNTPDGSNNWSFTYASQYATSSPGSVFYDGSTYAKSAAVFGVSNGTSWWGYSLVESCTYFSPNTTPAGNKIVIPSIASTMRCVGFLLPVWVASTDIVGYLYDDSDNLLAQTTLDYDSITTSLNNLILWDDGPVTLICGSTYRLVCTGTFRFGYVTYAVVAHAQTLGWGNYFTYTSGGTGAWTDTDNKRAYIWPIIDTISEPTNLDTYITLNWS